jgi:pyridoxamine 5'-phosphate oxidase family protein
MTSAFTNDELAYLREQRLGRLATVDADHAPHVVPVGYSIDEVTGQLVIGGTAMGASHKFRNVEGNARVAFVIDDIASTDPWKVRGIEVRGHGEALTDVDPPMPGLSREIIRLTPERIRSWGLGDGG